MKKVVLVLSCTMMTSTFALERKELMSLLKEASTKQESAYVDIRNCITVYGTNALPLLAEFAIDETLPWQQQLIARICYERIERKEDIEKLLATDWYQHPKFNPEWSLALPGPEGAMRQLVTLDVREAGLWYYCLEQVWKRTEEDGKIFRKSSPESWAGSCTVAVKDNPEERVWFLRICAEILAMSPPPRGLNGYAPCYFRNISLMSLRYYLILRKTITGIFSVLLSGCRNMRTRVWRIHLINLSWTA